MNHFDEAIAIRDRVLRGDLIIGILPVEAVAEMLAKFRAAGEHGDPAGWFELANCHAQGLGTAPDPESAIAAYQAAWDEGYGRDAGLALVRTAYFNRSDAVEADTIRATLDALLRDDADGSAALLAGWLHFAGYAVGKDLTRAIELHAQSAESGNAHAMFELSVLYGTGQGVEVDLEAAEHWCQRAADAGSPRAMYNLAAAAATQGDPVRAAAWYKKAADVGHGRAAAVLSVMYATGDGVEIDAVLCEQYCELAWEHGFDAFELFDALDIEPPFE